MGLPVVVSSKELENDIEASHANSREFAERLDLGNTQNHEITGFLRA
jgi:hypothetical protein